MTLRAIHAAEAIAAEPDWMTPFLASLAREDLASATLRGCRYDLRHFLAWHRTVQGSAFGVVQNPPILGCTRARKPSSREGRISV
jgi:hypothetical protein